MQLKFTEDIVPVTDFRNNAAEILEQLSKTGRPIVLTQRGRASAVLIDVREYQRLCERVETLERELAGHNAPDTSSTADGGMADDDLMRELERWIEQEHQP